jgi:hypothetical protein
MKKNLKGFVHKFGEFILSGFRRITSFSSTFPNTFVMLILSHISAWSRKWVSCFYDGKLWIVGTVSLMIDGSYLDIPTKAKRDNIFLVFLIFHDYLNRNSFYCLLLQIESIFCLINLARFVTDDLANFIIIIFYSVRIYGAKNSK